MKKTIRPILRDDLSRKGLEKRIDLRVYLDGRQTKFATPYSIAPAGIRNPDVLSETAPKKA